MTDAPKSPISKLAVLAMTVGRHGVPVNGSMREELSALLEACQADGTHGACETAGLLMNSVDFLLRYPRCLEAVGWAGRAGHLFGWKTGCDRSAAAAMAVAQDAAPAKEPKNWARELDLLG